MALFVLKITKKIKNDVHLPEKEDVRINMYIQ